MIQSEHTFVINTSIDQVWKYVNDIQGWASIFPGYQDCNLIDEDRTTWTIKVSAAGVTRTDKVQVHVEKWDGPTQVDFRFDVDDLPVEGNGAYIASAKSAHETEVSLKVCIIGSGPMAPMWEAVGTPMLPEFVKGFAAKLKAEIELVSGVGSVGAAETPMAMPMIKGMIQTLFAIFKSRIKALFGISSNKNNEGSL